MLDVILKLVDFSCALIRILDLYSSMQNNWASLHTILGNIFSYLYRTFYCMVHIDLHKHHCTVLKVLYGRELCMTAEYTATQRA